MTVDSQTGASSTDTTCDTLLGGRVQLRQPRAGYRAAIDPVLLAAALDVSRPGLVLDAGCGVGAAGLCLLKRPGADPGLRVIGLELQPDYADLARVNAGLNGLADRFEVVHGDLADPPAALRAIQVDHVVGNPPWLADDAGTASPVPGRDIANRETTLDLAAWIDACLGRLKSRGTFTLIHRADRLADILATLRGRAGGIVVFPLWPARGEAARRVLVRARKDVATPLRLAAGLVLHRAGGGYTAEADAVLRDGASVMP